MVALADRFRRHGPADRAKCTDRLLPSHLAALEAMAPCRTETLGGPVSQCTACHALAYSSHACNNRPGPTCQPDETTQWLAKPRELLLPVPSCLIPFPLPEALRQTARSPQQRMDHLLLQTSSAALKALALDPRDRGGQVGMLGVLHTWTRAMASPPPIPSLVPGGALSPDSSTWLPPP